MRSKPEAVRNGAFLFYAYNGRVPVRSSFVEGGIKRVGHCRNRTSDLVHAKHTRYQLRQAPGLSQMHRHTIIFEIFSQHLQLLPLLPLLRLRTPNHTASRTHRTNLRRTNTHTTQQLIHTQTQHTISPSKTKLSQLIHQSLCSLSSSQPTTGLPLSSINHLTTFQLYFCHLLSPMTVVVSVWNQNTDS